MSNVIDLQAHAPDLARKKKIRDLRRLADRLEAAGRSLIAMADESEALSRVLRQRLAEAKPENRDHSSTP